MFRVGLKIRVGKPTGTTHTFHLSLMQDFGLTLCVRVVNALNGVKITHIKGRLLDQTVVLFNCVPFQNGNFS